MITFDFDYYRPQTLAETMDLYSKIASQGKKVIYYSGGTEIICQARANQLHFDAVIDIKDIPECKQYGFQNDKFVIGSATTLTRISDSGLFPFLGECCRRSADHTARDKITIGGNICGRIPYREAVLPLLLSDSQAVIAGLEGIRAIPFTQIFNRKLNLKDDELLMQIVVDKPFTELPYSFIKKTKLEKVDYPLVTVALLEKDKRIRAAFSGLCSFPFRTDVETDPKSDYIDLNDILSKIIKCLPDHILDDMRGSAGYREFVTRNAFIEAWNKLKGVC